MMVLVHLTEYAPRCAKLPLGHPDRWRRYRNNTPEQIVRALLGRLERKPSQVRVRDEDPPIGEVDIMAEVRGIGPAPVATLQGVTAEEATEVLDRLAAQGWVPASLPENPFG